MREEIINRLKDLIPAAFSEDKLDVEVLRAFVGDNDLAGSERYRLTWAGKRNAIELAQEATRATLVPVRDQSLNWETTENVFIEGENLETLKLLLRPYYGRVKVIYIDPPYNTGKDFVFPDDYGEPLDTYLKLTGQKDGNGNLLTSNPETSGRFHSRWMSMMYPRLHVARELLREDGVILVSIDDHEAHNLRIILNEIFGEENFVAQLVWEKGRKNDAKLFSVGHEYIIIYARSKVILKEIGAVWREPKPGAQEIWEEYLRLREKHGPGGEADRAIEKEIQEWYRNLPDDHPSKKLTRYKHVDKWGPWRDRDISWPGGGGPRYEVIHPVTGQPCKIPERGWGFSTSEAMQKQIDLGLVVFREDHTEPPIRKAHLRPIPEETFDNGDADFDEEDVEVAEVGMQVMGSYIYKQSQVTVKYLRNLMGEKVFDNPKDQEVLARLIRYVTSDNKPDDEKPIVLDFFAGSASTAEAVLQLNAQRASKYRYRFILVQMAEPTPENSAARKAGYATITDIAKTRIKRAIERLHSNGAQGLDLGFRVFKLTESNFKQWPKQVEGSPIQQLELFVDALREGWAPESVATEVALKEAGFGLNFRMEIVLQEPNTVYRVTDPDRGQSFYLCLDLTFHLESARRLDLDTNTLFICRDISLDDATAANLASLCRLHTV